MIQVTKPFLPPKEEYLELVHQIWERNWLTNDGPVLRQLQEELKDYLGVANLWVVANGTLAIQIALKSLDIHGKVLTTPFSYVATTSSLVWEGIEPVFVDIDTNTFNIDPSKIEDKIDEETTAILATHCFGNPCEIDQIERIAKRHNLKVIYDAAHCFGTKYKGESVFNFGDISTVSFHATKLFHTVEGGAIISKNETISKRAFYHRNFGHDGPEKFRGVGINGKNSELHSAMGLVNLKHIDAVLDRREKMVSRYMNSLQKSGLKFQKITENAQPNFAYFPVLFENEKTTLQVKAALEECGIYPRRYFYPSLSNLNYTKGDTPVSDRISSQILCLPIYHDLSENEIDLVVSIILKTI
ncbi:MAG TPA: aminotransferase DegT [Flavobacteriales bacterium]|jgi:dTDP-4-amino-4,6-dideoxygalactose transaminase|nr:aminotransferase DegT [Flavobacteriales bacterium]